MSDSTDINSDQYENPQDEKGFWEKAGSATPGVKQVMNSASVINSAIESDEVSAMEATTAVAADIANLGLEIYGAFANPLGLLVGAGLDMVLALVEPLQKIITWLSGDPDAMSNLQGRWRQFKDVLIAMSEAVDEAWQSALETSQSPTADAARDKVSGMAAALNGCAAAVGEIESHLGYAQMLSKTIYEVVKSLLSILIEQLIIYGLTALATSWATFGASIASFLAWATGKSAIDIATASLKVTLAQATGGRLALIGSEFLDATFRQASKDMLLWGGGMLTSIAGGVQGTGDTSAGVPSGGSSDPGVDMAGYIDVDPEEFNVCGSKLAELKGDADSLSAAVASDTDTDYWTWGLACLMFVDGYNDQKASISEDIALISPALDGNAQRFTEVAASYKDADDQAASGLTQAGGG
ncbi:hypothetical protein [Glycomyces paridis]|uniref:WXG100 family type VII secretion target n=1 Tax=Glycomyces paridis TaxID=2126555 RepID=A0A4S8PP45_9ACTN|nr:hypothetical protein [Glycomyces paridis]THV30104.1 hypothetical protein E9998_06920 [Glycomyces paridis]